MDLSGVMLNTRLLDVATQVSTQSSAHKPEANRQAGAPAPHMGGDYLRHRWHLGLPMSSLRAVLVFSLARLGIRRGRSVLALEV
jgi:hypothetical protein